MGEFRGPSERARSPGLVLLRLSGSSRIGPWVLSITCGAFFQIGDVFQARGNPSVAIWHSDLRQTLGVHDFIFLDNAASIEEKSRHSVNLIRCERSFLISRHGAVDVVPDRSGKRPGRHRSPLEGSVA